MIELFRDFLRNRATALTVLRGLSMGLGIYIVGHEDQFHDLVEVGVAVVNGALFGVSSQTKRVPVEPIP